MTPHTDKSFDPRLLAHHPAGRHCVDICAANGWMPQDSDVLRLVRLWDEVQRGGRSEVALSQHRLEFARWLIEHGRLSEGAA